MAEEAALWEVYLPVIPLSIFDIIPPNLHIHSALIDAARSTSLTSTPLAHQRVYLQLRSLYWKYCDYSSQQIQDIEQDKYWSRFFSSHFDLFAAI